MSNKGSTTAAVVANCGPTTGLMAAFATRRTSFVRTPSQSVASLLFDVPAADPLSQGDLTSRRVTTRWVAASACASLRSCRQYCSSSLGKSSAAPHSSITAVLSSSLLAARLPNVKDARNTSAAQPMWVCKQRTICLACEVSAARASQGRSCIESLPKIRAMFNCSSSLKLYCAAVRVRSASRPSSTNCACLFGEDTRLRKSAVIWIRSCTSFALFSRFSGFSSICMMANPPRLTTCR
mmetsp:Transcript_24575/g.47847  ORF Transcript_24575/g.47847 Transcript_24575/m.47847 type:complete len:238 (-) Transcript_24575:1406-2119(-)